MTIIIFKKIILAYLSFPCITKTPEGYGQNSRVSSVHLQVGSFDIIEITETWLKAIASSALFNDRYDVFRMDRNSSNSQKTRGGGVLIAAKPCIVPQ